MTMLAITLPTRLEASHWYVAVSEALVTKIVKLLVISPSAVLLVTTIWYLLVVLVRAVFVSLSILIHRKVGSGTPIAEHDNMAGSEAITVVVFWEGCTEMIGGATQRD